MISPLIFWVPDCLNFPNQMQIGVAPWSKNEKSFSPKSLAFSTWGGKKKHVDPFTSWAGKVVHPVLHIAPHKAANALPTAACGELARLNMLALAVSMQVSLVSARALRDPLRLWNCWGFEAPRAISSVIRFEGAAIEWPDSTANPDKKNETHTRPILPTEAEVEEGIRRGFFSRKRHFFFFFRTLFSLSLDDDPAPGECRQHSLNVGFFF